MSGFRSKSPSAAVQAIAALALGCGSALVPAAMAYAMIGAWPAELALLLGAIIGVPTLVTIYMTRTGRAPLPGYALWLLFISAGSFFIPFVWTFVVATTFLIGGTTWALIRHGFFHTADRGLWANGKAS